MSGEPKKRRKRQSIPQRRPYEGPVVAKPPGSTGRPPFVPTDEQRQQVKCLVTADFTNPEISIALRIPQATLERAFREELSSGKTEVFAAIATGILRGAMEGDRTLQIYASKARMGWRERSVGVTALASSEQSVGQLFTISITG